MNKNTIPFPNKLPQGFLPLKNEPQFNPRLHLQLEMPEQIIHLQDLGYKDSDIKNCCTNFAVSSPFRILSKEGVVVLEQVCNQLKENSVSCERIENMVRGGTYCSQFLRDLCLSPQVADLLSQIYGIAVAPHTMPLQLGHLNFTPDNLDKAVDKWHHDTLALDYVMMVSDPTKLEGGEFQYFMGTKEEAAELAKNGELPPLAKVVSPKFPGPGYAVALHGYMVVHRGAKLTKSAPRITMVNGYVPADISIPDHCRFDDLQLVDPAHILLPEWARYKAWLAKRKLEKLVEDMPYTDDREIIIEKLEIAIDDIKTAIDELQKEVKQSMHHYGG